MPSLLLCLFGKKRTPLRSEPAVGVGLTPDSYFRWQRTGDRFYKTLPVSLSRFLFLSSFTYTHTHTHTHTHTKVFSLLIIPVTLTCHRNAPDTLMDYTLDSDEDFIALGSRQNGSQFLIHSTISTIGPTLQYNNTLLILEKEIRL